MNTNVIKTIVLLDLMISLMILGIKFCCSDRGVRRPFNARIQSFFCVERNLLLRIEMFCVFFVEHTCNSEFPDGLAIK